MNLVSNPNKGFETRMFIMSHTSMYTPPNSQNAMTCSIQLFLTYRKTQTHTLTRLTSRLFLSPIFDDLWYTKTGDKEEPGTEVICSL